MERTKLLTVAVVGLLLLNLFTIGFLVLNAGAFRGPEPSNQNRGGPALLIMERLGFDEEQRQAFKKLADAHHDQTERLSAQSVALYRSYYELLLSEKPDTVRANALSEQIAQNQLTVAKVNLAHFAQIKALCHPDQQASFTRLVGDLSKLFGRQPRPQRQGEGRPPDTNFENKPLHP